MKIDITPEIFFQTARSGGKGGQNVNKVETMVEGRWHIQATQLITGEQKLMLAARLATKITADGKLLVKSQSERTQLGNKENVIKKMNLLVEKALRQEKKRRATKMPKLIKEKILKKKKENSVKKEQRKKLKPGDY